MVINQNNRAASAPNIPVTLKKGQLYWWKLDKWWYNIYSKEKINLAIIQTDIENYEFMQKF